ncbi:unnamed protein product [Moneuplotes crassus]|uniref:NADP-dependent oxidoreductase domain-containing protein n=1 Tax=Euplotes crassus TaxID=5936 RepID=A0AAD1XN44_EUPCR|nr:unnamed protein product [Moneuplotes crassus]
MTELNKYIELNNGNKMPLIGYGTFSGEEEKELHDCIVHAIVDLGYRHLDTAKVYLNEEVIGGALQECFEKGIKREDLFITSKVWKDDYHDVESAIKESLRKLQLEYLDLYLVHWMVTDIDWKNLDIKGPTMQETWKQMERIYENGLSKNIGISNCPAMMYLDLLAGAKIKPQVNQIETNPHLQQKALIEFTRKFGTETTAYAPIGAQKFTGDGSLFDNEDLKAIADKHGVTVPQICLAWNINRGVVVIPKSTNKDRMKANFEALSITLGEDEMATIAKLDKNERFFDPAKWENETGEEDWDNSPIWA